MTICAVSSWPLAWGLAFASSGLAVAMGPLALLLLGRRQAAALPNEPDVR